VKHQHNRVVANLESSFTLLTNGGDGLPYSSHRPLMRSKIPSIPLLSSHSSCFPTLNSLMASSLTRTHHSDPPQDDLDDGLCSDPQLQEERERSASDTSPFGLGSPSRCLTGESRVERAWAHWAKLGRPKLIVAPMVDNSELPFRMLCRKYGAEAAYTPMLHSRIFTENEKYRSQEFTTCQVNSKHFTPVQMRF
jgi:tRNA-dihydrouridine synthase 1